ncbi:hypothetical protein, partial [Leclercia adecarboxylata]|uniref:hypothetical protein n=1 Tax=Leclercia adecarboxylata TaxID=83655 RepID=UPI002949E1E9
ALLPPFGKSLILPIQYRLLDDYLHLGHSLCEHISHLDFYETRNKQYDAEKYDDFICLYFLTLRCLSFFDQTSQL